MGWESMQLAVGNHNRLVSRVVMFVLTGWPSLCQAGKGFGGGGRVVRIKRGRVLISRSV